MKRKIVLLWSTLLLTMFFLGVFLTNTQVYAKKESGFSIEVSSRIDLYDYNNEQCAVYFKQKDGGYIILDSTTMEIIEFSNGYDPTNYDINEKKQLYLGPTQYYEETNNGFLRDKNINRKCNFQKSDIKESCQNKTSSSGNYIDGSSYSVAVGNVYLSDMNTLSNSTVLVDNNINGTCGSTAATILFLYYYDYIDSKYITRAERANFNNLTLKLISYIEPNCGGTSYSELKKGINKFLADRNLSENCKYITNVNILFSVINKIESYIDADKPCIVGLKSSTPTYGAHWVVATGYATYIWDKPDSTLPCERFVQINDGWGNDNIWINTKYIDGTIYLD